MTAVAQITGDNKITDSTTGARHASPPGPRWQWLATILLGLAGLVLVVAPSVTGGLIPGDLGDGRFNSYILEHFYRWVGGQDASFWNADFFYPFPLTTAFSDNFLGSGLIYAAVRAVGLDRENAFRLWFVAGYAINFGACLYVLVRLGYSRIASACGAFLFAFGLPITAQEGHAQLIYRFGVPLAVLYLEEFRQRRQFALLVLAAFWTTWQFYCAVYTGYFLTLFLTALVASHVLCRGRGALTGLRGLPREARKLWWETPRRAKTSVVLALTILAGAMMLVCAPYVEVSRLYGFRRTWSDINQMLPRPASYLLANNSRLWPSSGPLFDTLPMQQEHAMFIGGAPLLLVALAATLIATGRARLDRLFARVALAILLVMLLTMSIDGVSIYRLIVWLPGVNAIRAVARIIVVLLFPCGLLVAASFDAVITARLPGWSRYGMATLLAALLVFEASYITHFVTPESTWRARVAAIAAQLPKTLPAAPILLVGPDPDPTKPWRQEIDAMMLAQDRGWRTLNGYSGNQPPQHVLTGQCWDAPRLLATGLRFLGADAMQRYDTLIKDVVMVGYPSCDSAELSRPPRITAFAGPVPTSLMAKTRLRIERLSVASGRILITASIANGSTVTLPGASSTAMPIRLSAQFIDARETPPDLLTGSGWTSRQELGIDIPPGTSRRLEIPMAPPAASGTYRVALSMVQEGVAWFHNRGMPVAISTQTVTVESSVRVSGDDR